MRLLTASAIAAAGLVLATALVAYRAPETSGRRIAPRVTATEAAVVEHGRCSIDHARFGSERAQLVRLARGEVTTFVVLEMGRRDPALKAQRLRWLRATYGQGEAAWLGVYSSSEAALARAASLCPPSLRCEASEAGCGRLVPIATPSQLFLGTSAHAADEPGAERDDALRFVIQSTPR